MPLPSKGERIRRLLAELDKQPPAASGLEAYAQMSNTLNHLEDALPDNPWAPPRTYVNGELTDRMYPSTTECFETVEGYPGVTVMVHTKEFIFISRFGAIEIQKDTGESEVDIHFSTRSHAVIYKKPDAYGDGVWHDKNADNCPVPKPPGTISFRKELLLKPQNG